MHLFSKLGSVDTDTLTDSAMLTATTVAVTVMVTYTLSWLKGIVKSVREHREEENKYIRDVLLRPLEERINDKIDIIRKEHNIGSEKVQAEIIELKKDIRRIENLLLGRFSPHGKDYQEWSN